MELLYKIWTAILSKVSMLWSRPCVCDALSQLARESGDEVENVYCLVCGKGMDDD